VWLVAVGYASTESSNIPQPGRITYSHTYNQP